MLVCYKNRTCVRQLLQKSDPYYLLWWEFDHRSRIYFSPETIPRPLYISSFPHFRLFSEKKKIEVFSRGRKKAAIEKINPSKDEKRKPSDQLCRREKRVLSNLGFNNWRLFFRYIFRMKKPSDVEILSVSFLQIKLLQMKITEPENNDMVVYSKNVACQTILSNFKLSLLTIIIRARTV